ncbi:MAG TPA: glutamine synthetase family protein [Burkholderiaceae bacterium]|nr:glutamine synthetase family protein [Burkholderiaceae bacterium]
MTASSDFRSPGALAAPHRAVVQAALDRLSAELGVPVVAVECAVGDFTSVARGKSVGHQDFVGMAGCRFPSVVFGLTLTAGEPETVFGPLLPESYLDISLVPDLATLCAQPGRAGTAAVICEPAGPLPAGRYARPVCASEFSPRAALRRVLARLDAAGLAATVAPELELFLVDRREADGQVSLHAPASRAGAPARERACEAYSLERTGHFADYFDTLFAACHAQGIPVCGHAHEAAYSQYEVNFMPGEPLAQADAVFRFKRLARQVAAQFGFLATFAPKPFLDQPGTGMHWHFSLQHKGGALAGEPATHTNAFAHPDGSDRDALGAFIGGLQRHADAAMAFFAPHDMAFDRIRLSNASPSSASWGHDDRAVAFRIPQAGAQNRRIENRLPGGDANPYLIVAATLGMGLAGIEQGLAPAGESAGVALPRTLPDACDALEASALMRELFGDPLVDLFVALKRHESAERNAAADPRHHWDLVHLVELA